MLKTSPFSSQLIPLNFAANLQDFGIEDVVFPEEGRDNKHKLPEDDVLENTPKRRRMLSLAEIVDDSEAEDEDFLLTGVDVEIPGA